MSCFAVLCDLLVDGTDRPPIRNAILLVEDGRITKLGEASEIPIPEGYDTIDCQGETVLPGLINSHSHITWSGADPDGSAPTSIVDQAKLPMTEKALCGFANLLEEMSSGVTTIRSLGERDGIDIALRDAINACTLPGPRLLACGAPLRPWHGTAAFLGHVADGVDEVRKMVRQRIAEGVDVIKMFATNIQAGPGEEAYRRGDLTGVPAYTKEELRVAVEEAHGADVAVAAHAIGGPALRWAAEVGVDSVEHANLIREDDIDSLVKSGCVLSDPNYYLFFDDQVGFRSRATWGNLPAWWRKKVTEAGEHTRRVHRMALQQGVKFSLALDSSHGFMWRELRCMVDILGASPQQALAAATRDSAALCRLPDVGTLEPGKRADLISVAGNPLQDIDAMKDVRVILRDGVRYDLFLSQCRKTRALAEELCSMHAANAGTAS